NAEPAERITLVERNAVRGRYRLSADAMKPVAPGDEITVETVVRAVMLERYVGPVGVEVVHGDVRRLEQDLSARRQPGRDQVLNDAMLAVDGDRFAGQPEQVDTMSGAVPAQVDPGMTH